LGFLVREDPTVVTFAEKFNELIHPAVLVKADPGAEDRIDEAGDVAREMEDFLSFADRGVYPLRS
jgi:hypothetical protein